jgi:hypothetical protein
MQVRAIQDGFYKGKRVRAGAIFDFPEGQKLGKWMEEIKIQKPIVGKAPVKEPTTFSEVNAGSGQGASAKEDAVKKALAGKNPAKKEDSDALV